MGQMKRKLVRFPYLTKIRSARPNARFKVSRVALVITKGRTAWIGG